ncbi:hypothetical protein HKCCE2091_06940 [Rhodobacterales bacterium HKCCE2091]|nr:hypothetical protein [Rhodobacterales bacterium HKCCE2091]
MRPRSKITICLFALVTALPGSASADLLGDVAGGLGDALGGTVDALGGAVGGTLDGVGDVVEGVTEPVGDLVGGVLGSTPTPQQPPANNSQSGGFVPVESFDPARADPALRSQFQCSAGGNSTVYNGLPVMGRSGAALGVVHDAIVNRRLEITRVRFLSDPGVTGSEVCVEYGSNRIRIGGSHLSLPIDATQIVSAAR